MRGEWALLAAIALGCAASEPIDYSGPTADWPEWAGDKGGLHHSPLTQVRRGNLLDRNITGKSAQDRQSPSGYFGLHHALAAHNQVSRALDLAAGASVHDQRPFCPNGTLERIVLPDHKAIRGGPRVGVLPHSPSGTPSVPEPAPQAGGATRSAKSQ